MSQRVMLLTLVAIASLAIACGGSNGRASTAAETPRPVAPGAAAGPASAASPAAAEAAPALPVTVTGQDGRPVTVTDVGRIVSLNGDITEVIYALGLGGNVAGVDVSATYPEAARSLPKIDNRRQISAEAVLSLKPTLIIGNDNAGPPAALQQVRDAGVPVLVIAYPLTVESVPAKIRTIAAALGVPARGEALAAQTQAEIDAARALAARATSKPKVAFLYLRGAGVQQIAGKNTAADSIIAATGATNTGAAAGLDGYKPLTAEAIVTAAPDVIVTLDAALESVGGLDGLLGLPGIAQTPAGQKRRVLTYDDQYLLGMGPRAGQALSELVKGLHPELK